MYNLKQLFENIQTSWKEILLNIYDNNTEYLQSIEHFLNSESKQYGEQTKIYPPINLLFNAFDQTNFEDTRIIILGQDPYHGPNQAHGLAFSVPFKTKVPPSLKQIFKELKIDVGKEIPTNGDLTSWSKQGVLLLNTALTVRQSKPNSHSKIWDKFTKLILTEISNNLHNTIFMLWGNHAKKYKYLINDTHHILEATHPSPLSSNRGGWFGTKHFSKANALLNNPIKW